MIGPEHLVFGPYREEPKPYNLTIVPEDHSSQDHSLDLVEDILRLLKLYVIVGDFTMNHA